MRALFSIIILVVIGGVIWFIAQSPTPEAEAPTQTTSNDQEEEAQMDQMDDDAPVIEAEGGTDVGAEFPVIEDGDDMESSQEEPTESNDEQAEAQEPKEEESFAALVTYTNSGFTPKTVTVQKGETVRFLDDSVQGMWVGSDNHPTHTLYPEDTASDCLGSAFDQCERSSQGEFWEFTFNSVGSWDYHNHVRSSHRGTVVVE